jgi:hypothetical protein
MHLLSIGVFTSPEHKPACSILPVKRETESMRVFLSVQDEEYQGKKLMWNVIEKYSNL